MMSELKFTRTPKRYSGVIIPAEAEIELEKLYARYKETGEPQETRFSCEDGLYTTIGTSKFEKEDCDIEVDIYNLDVGYRWVQISVRPKSETNGIDHSETIKSMIADAVVEHKVNNKPVEYLWTIPATGECKEFGSEVQAGVYVDWHMVDNGQGLREIRIRASSTDTKGLMVYRIQPDVVIGNLEQNSKRINLDGLGKIVLNRLSELNLIDDEG